jgi:hypothetical protein
MMYLWCVLVRGSHRFNQTWLIADGDIQLVDSRCERCGVKR